MQPHGYIHPHQHAAYLSAADANRRSSMPLHPGYTHSSQGTPVPMPVNMPVPAVGAGNRGNSQNPSIIVGNVDTPPSEVQGDLQGNGTQQQQQHHFLKSKSIFTPIDDRGSVLAQHLGLVSRSPPPLRAAQSPGQGQGKSQSQPQQESHPQGQERSWTEAPQTEDGQSQQQQQHASHPSRTHSLPVTAGSDAAPPIPPPVSRSSIGGHLNAKRPRLTVQIPGERGSVEPDQSQKKVESDQELADDAHPADQRDNRQETDASMNNNPVSPRSNGNGNITNRRISRSTSRTPLPLPHDKDVHAVEFTLYDEPNQ
ncbi:hypothetical protein KEM56_005161 [Ascosphaera pollenicola]|nr:hypothetical protein KEM56_005161 [Ascosphaera pollenicola]